MLQERVAEDVFVFTSELYLQATASAILTQEGIAIVDTLPFPDETREMLRFIRRRSRSEIRSIILTHYHPDHSYGACLLPGELIAHERCRRILERNGQQILDADRIQNPELAGVRIRLPETIFDRGSLSLHLGKKTITLMHTPGHTADGISVYVKEDKVLLAGDLVMPVPYIVGGDSHVMRESLHRIGELALDNVVQGHGDVLLRGEIPGALETSVLYLDAIEEKVDQVLAQGLSRDALTEWDIEHCHKSRIPLNGLVETLHRANMAHLYDLKAAGADRTERPTA